MRILGRPWLFDLGAEIYSWFSANELWRESCAHLSVFFPPPGGHRPLRVVDLGSGPGVTAISLAQSSPDLRIVGIDLSPRMVHEADHKTERAQLCETISYVVADAAALPFANGTFDAAAAHSFLYLVPDRAAVLCEAFRVLRPGGVYASMEPREGGGRRGVLRERWRNVRFLVSVLLWRPYSKWHGRLDEQSFPAALQQAGFSKTGTESALEGLGIVGYGQK